MRAALRRFWPHARALLVTVHLAAIGLAAVPGPDGNMTRASWEDPVVRAELTTWSARFGMTVERFTDLIFPLAKGLFEGRNALRRPVEPYLDYTGCEQPWRLFSAPDRVPSRMQVLVHHRGTVLEEPIFEERSERYTWMAPFFGHARMRRAVYWYGWPPTWGGRGEFCEWLSRRIFPENPTVDYVRCRYFRGPSPSPAEARANVAPRGEWHGDTVVRHPNPSLVRMR